MPLPMCLQGWMLLSWQQLLLPLCLQMWTLLSWQWFSVAVLFTGVDIVATDQVAALNYALKQRVDYSRLHKCHATLLCFYFSHVTNHSGSFILQSKFFH